MTPQRIFLLLLLLWMAGCTGISTPGAQSTPEAGATPTATNVVPAELTATPPGSAKLRIWLPPAFDPNANTAAGKLLKDRLDEFTAQNPEIHIEVRLKEPEGQGGLLDSLTTASAAAPLALPDLIALPHTALETAALKGLVYPYTSLSQPIDFPEWFEYAQQLARVQDSTFGIPFAGDAMVLTYRPSALAQPPKSLAAALQSPGPLVFPAADPLALYTLLLYQAAGGSIRDDQGRPILQADILEQVLAFFHDGTDAEYTPFWLTQLQSDEQAWGEFQGKGAPLVATWMSRFLKNQGDDLAVAPLPTLGGNPFTLADGWVWALANPDPVRQGLAAELAEFLSQPEFLAQWTSAAGYAPTRTSALDQWDGAAPSALAKQILQSAQLQPASDLLASLGPALQQAAIEVLKKQSDPQAAAQNAADSLAIP